MIEFKTKKPTYKDLSLYLGVSESAVKQYIPKKRALMLGGLWLLQEQELNKNKEKIDMKVETLKNGSIIKSMNGIKIILNKEKKINGKKSMFQILKAGGVIPSLYSKNLSYVPADWEDFFNNLETNNKNFNLHFGVII